MLFIGLFYSSLFYSNEFSNANIEIKLFFISIVISFIILNINQLNKFLRYILALLPAVAFYGYVFLICDVVYIEPLFKFLNITSFDNDDNISLVESAISKAIMAYLIYQFVISLRKDTRK